MNRATNQGSSVPSVTETTRSATLVSVCPPTVALESSLTMLGRRDAKPVGNTARRAAMRTTVWTVCRVSGRTPT